MDRVAYFRNVTRVAGGSMSGEIVAEDAAQAKPEALPEEWRYSLAISACLFGLFVLFVYAYARQGGPWVDSLDDRNGEIVAQRAQSAAAAGRVDRSIGLFEEALGLGFQTPDQYVWIRQKYVPVLLEAEQFARAETVAEEVLASGVPEIGDWVGRQAFSNIHSAVSRKGSHELALLLAQQWHDAGLRCGNIAARGQGMFLQAVSLRTLGRYNEARSALAAAYEATPTPEMKAAVESELGQIGRS